MALTAEADYVLRTIEERGIRFVRLWFTDMLGILKSFTITSQELEGALDEGMGFDGSSIEGFSRIDESRHDRDARSVDVPDRAVDAGETPVARMFCDISNPDGTPFDGDPRYVLKRQLKRAADLGYTFYVGPELEYFYFKSADDPTPRPRRLFRPHAARRRHRLPQATRCRRSRRWASRSSTSHHEVAPSQHEIDLRYADALTMADNVMTYRLAVKEVAQEHGVYATFMPKPIFGRERQRDAHAPVAVQGRPERVLRRDRQVPPVEDGASRTSPGC